MGRHGTVGTSPSSAEVGLQGQVRREWDRVRGRPLVDDLAPLVEGRDLGLDVADLLPRALADGTRTERGRKGAGTM